jgi:diguanylate cyclase
MLAELGELGVQTGRFEQSVGRHADIVESADSLESLADAVRQMVAESRTMHALVSQTRERLQHEHDKASELSQRVRMLEDELRRLSDEVSTDALTQVANRRGLQQAFDAERSRAERSGATLALALLDIDNFKKLNDRLGHGAGDQALKSLAERVKQQLRPADAVARYGGEEFVVMLPEASLEQAQEVLTRMQRALTSALFMHGDEQVFVTFSAGLTLYRAGESIEQALDRADEALYEAKRTGKNRTCLA